MQTKNRSDNIVERADGTSDDINVAQPVVVTDEFWMEQALAQAMDAAKMGEVPVGAVLVGEEGLLAAAGNSPIRLNDPTAHAEILTLRKASEALKNYRLPNTTLYVTLEPCIMCMGALIQARIGRLVYGATDPKTGAAASVYTIGRDGRLNHEIEIHGGILADRCGDLLRAFFKTRRAG
ncbi:MAG TPA: tRNA adenosine(34) deaminase TadA [Desulfobulbaceae bacterium]|nr:tRNA adenosine(34) deaminase TadA [Desulfobulbaceae bacterium]